MEDFEKHYFPHAWEKKRLSRLTPAELGREMAEEVVKRIKEEATND